MILRKTPSVFLRALRSIPQEKLPRLPERRLSARRQRRLEDAVFARIAEEQNRTVFDEDPAAVQSPSDDAYVTYDSPFEMTVIGRGAWKQNLRRYAGGILAACLCFAVLVTAVLHRRDIALYFAEHSWLVETDVSEHEGTQALNTEPFRPETTGVPQPENTSDGYSMQITKEEILENEVRLHVTLTFPEMMDGLAVQYRRVVLSLWDHDVRNWRAKYDVYTSNQPKAEIMAGDIHFPLVGLGQTTTADAVITIPRDLNDYQGVWCLTLEGLTLVRDSSEPTDPENTLIAEVLTDGSVHALFTSFEKVETVDPTQPLPPRDTVTPPPQSSHRPPLASEDYSLLLSDTKVKDDTVTLDLVLQTPNGKPDGYAIYYETCEIELWNHEKQVWEGKFGTDSVDVPFEKMLLAGDVHFVVDRYSENTYASLSYDLPHDGWYRLTLTGLVLVREAREGEEAEYHLVTEMLDEGAVWVVFYKE